MTSYTYETPGSLEDIQIHLNDVVGKSICQILLDGIQSIEICSGSNIIYSISGVNLLYHHIHNPELVTMTSMPFLLGTKIILSIAKECLIGSMTDKERIALTYHLQPIYIFFRYNIPVIYFEVSRMYFPPFQPGDVLLSYSPPALPYAKFVSLGGENNPPLSSSSAPICAYHNIVQQSNDVQALPEHMEMVHSIIHSDTHDTIPFRHHYLSPQWSVCNGLYTCRLWLMESGVMKRILIATKKPDVFESIALSLGKSLGDNDERRKLFPDITTCQCQICINNDAEECSKECFYRTNKDCPSCDARKKQHNIIPFPAPHIIHDTALYTLEATNGGMWVNGYVLFTFKKDTPKNISVDVYLDAEKRNFILLNTMTAHRLFA